LFTLGTFLKNTLFNFFTTGSSGPTSGGWQAAAVGPGGGRLFPSAYDAFKEATLGAQRKLLPPVRRLLPADLLASPIGLALHKNLKSISPNGLVFHRNLKSRSPNSKWA
jgi:hypothetical protein